MVDRKDRDSSGERGSSAHGAASWVSWQAALYLLVMGWICAILVPLTSLWWIVPVLAIPAPLAYAMIERPRPPLEKPNSKTKEKELLAALTDHGEITPTTAAMHTSLTVDEAAKMLDRLAKNGHLKLRPEGGVTSYALKERSNPKELPVGDTAPVEDPLSERELEVLTLLSSGRTNAEISTELFVALGTVKAHVNNIYRKLGAKNRAEAISRARTLRLL